LLIEILELNESYHKAGLKLLGEAQEQKLPVVASKLPAREEEIITWGRARFIKKLTH
jgi:hypothetical protein